MSDVMEIFTPNGDMAPLGDHLTRMETTALKEALAKSITITSQAVAYMAAVWNELERRGEDLSALRSGISAYLPMVASGHLDAEAVVAFAGQRMVLASVATLPLEEQRRLARGGTVSVLLETGEGEFAESDLPLNKIPPMAIRRVIADGRIAATDEQRSRIAPPRHRRKRQAKVIVDAVKGTLTVSGKTCRLADMHAVARQSYKPANADAASRGQILLTDDEHKVLRMRAAESSMTQQELIRLALALSGMI